ncbi:hypothetical protein PN36_10620 [Candidatus Thiomargarita nelsonii]|uniref:Uncharacterized protein n=1 Tax=Candidatus Thiomargarita nelsonii TaxID=1003181 RepID=A0A0A6PGE5_9GAMM|nr:hypothetical protein PN36_10620 [Candidatus Thiomargarita nelsonii]
MQKYYLSLLLVCLSSGCATKTPTKSIDADSLRQEIEAVCAEGGRKEDIFYFIEEGDNAKASDIARRLRSEKLKGCD